MTRVMAVTFEQYGQLHYLDAGPQQYRVGEQVLYPTAEGAEVAQVVWAPEHTVLDQELPLCGGLASPADLARDQRHRARRAEVLATAAALIDRHQLAMKVVAVDVTDDLTAIYYSAPERVDFRALLRDLLDALKTRLDLRQVGDRDVASLTGSVGACGRELCCSTWLTKIEPVGMRLAREQHLPANPLRIQGACGRLMCCLKYEHPLYVEFEQAAPPIGSQVTDGQFTGTVVSHQVPAQSVGVRDSDGQVHRCPVESVCATAELRRGRVKAMAERGQEESA